MADKINLNDFLRLENINCTDSNGVVYEHYDSLLLRKDVERGHNTYPKPNWLESIFSKADPDYNELKFAKFYMSEQGLFLPSFALTCNILAELYANKNNVKFAKVLNQYNNLEKRYGGAAHIQNTLVNGDTKQIIHYPNYADSLNVTVYGQDREAQPTRKTFAFNFTDFKNLLLEDALKEPNCREFLQNLTGLQNPEILGEIGTYFEKIPFIYVTGSPGIHAALLGGTSAKYSDECMFEISTIGYLSRHYIPGDFLDPSSGFTRGVRNN
jgi:hypothetical protein